jgi:GAF domain-containing protein
LSESEAQRLQILEDLQIQYSVPAHNFDRITHIAAIYFRTPISYISFIDDKTQWLKSTIGITQFLSNRRDAFCNETIKSDSIFIVHDAAKDHRFSQNQFVIGSPHIRFYAGAPIIYQPGVHLGAVCVIDHTPRTFDRDDRQMLIYLAELVVTELRLTKAARLLRKAYGDNRL